MNRKHQNYRIKSLWDNKIADFKMTSQANHLAKLQNLLSECQRQSIHYQRLYKRREINPKTGQYQSTWYWFGEHGTTNIR